MSSTRVVGIDATLFSSKPKLLLPKLLVMKTLQLHPHRTQHVMTQVRSNARHTHGLDLLAQCLFGDAVAVLRLLQQVQSCPLVAKRSKGWTWQLLVCG